MFYGRLLAISVTDKTKENDKEWQLNQEKY